MLFKRLDNLLEGKSQASALFSGPYYLAEQLGYRKIIDTTFMIASMITGTPDEEDLKKFFRALKRAQRDIDLRPDLLYALLQERVSDALSRHYGHAPLGTRASASCSSHTPKRRSYSRAIGLRNARFSKAASPVWGQTAIKTWSSGWLDVLPSKSRREFPPAARRPK